MILHSLIISFSNGLWWFELFPLKCLPWFSNVKLTLDTLNLLQIPNFSSKILQIFFSLWNLMSSSSKVHSRLFQLMVMINTFGDQVNSMRICSTLGMATLSRKSHQVDKFNDYGCFLNHQSFIQSFYFWILKSEFRKKND